jgi:hypothetical protein
MRTSKNPSPRRSVGWSLFTDHTFRLEATCVSIRRVVRYRASRAAYPSFHQWCGVGAVLVGVLFVVWGYIDRPDISESLSVAVHVLSFVVPTLFLVVVVGLAVPCASRRGALKTTGLVLSLFGSTWGVVGSIANLHPLYASLAESSGLPRYLFDWLLVLQTGLALTGIAPVSSRPSRGVGPLLLAIGVCGWVYSLTDSGVIMEARLVHVGFGLLFSLGWVVLGVKLWVRGMGQAEEPHAST